MEQYEKLAELMLERRRAGKPFTFYHYMIDLTGGPCIYKRISGCGSGTEYMAVTPWGDLYPCHQFVGDEKFRLGDVWTGVTNTEIQADFASCNVYAHPSAAIAGQDCTAPAAAPQTPTTPPAPSAAFTKRAASSLKNAWNAPSCSKPLRHWITTHDNRANLRICAPLPI